MFSVALEISVSYSSVLKDNTNITDWIELKQAFKVMEKPTISGLKELENECASEQMPRDSCLVAAQHMTSSSVAI